MKTFISRNLYKAIILSGLLWRSTVLVFAGIEGENGGGGLMNPLDATDIIEFIISIIDVLLKFALPIIIFFIMYGGFKLVTARGETEQISEGKAAITWAVIGGVIVLGAKVIIEVIQGTVDSITP